MIQLSPTSKIMLGIEAMDFRKGIDSICRLIKAEFDQDPMQGSIYAFVNRRKTQLRMLSYDGSGFWLCTKRLSQGNFWWPKSKDSKLVASEAKKLMVILWGQNPEQSDVYEDWRKIS